jgi:hypothetical protein
MIDLRRCVGRHVYRTFLGTMLSCCLQRSTEHHSTSVESLTYRLHVMARPGQQPASAAYQIGYYAV